MYKSLRCRQDTFHYINISPHALTVWLMVYPKFSVICYDCASNATKLFHAWAVSGEENEDMDDTFFLNSCARRYNRLMF